MESHSETTQTVSALKLPILKTGDYDLWRMRIEQYITHTNYALWEVIMNGDAPTIASASVCPEGPIPLKTVEQKLARKNEMKAKSTLLLAIPDEHLLKFHRIKDAKTLWEAIKARFGGNKESKKIQKTILKQQYENFATSRSKGLDKTYDSLNSQNVAFVSSENTSSTNEAVNTAHEVSTASLQGQSSSSTYVDDAMFSFFTNQSNSPQLDNEDLEQIDTDDLEEMDLKWALRNQGNKNGDALRRVIPVETPTNALVVQDGIGGYDWSFQAEEGITNFALMAYTSQGSSSSDSQLEEDLKEKDDLKLKLENFKESSKNLTKLINIQISAKDKAGLGYDSQMNESEVVHSVFNNRESDVDDSPVNDRFKTGKGFHAVPPPYIGNYMPSRPDLSFAGLDDSVYKTKVSETIASKTSKDNLEKPKTIRTSAPIIEDWDTDSDNDTATLISTARHVNTAISKPKVNDALPITYSYFKAHSPVKRAFNQKSAAKTYNLNEKVKTAKVNFVTTVGPKAVVSVAVENGENAVKSSACWIWRPTGNIIDHTSKDSGSYILKRFDYGNPQYTLQDQGIFDSGCSRHMTGNKSFLTDYQEIYGGFVAFGGSPK
ncbi:hypothetical protein Tco_1516971 [Tanacetum coccineum]